MSFFNANPGPFSLLASLIGIAFANKLNSNQQNSLGNFFESLGQSLLTYAAQQQLLQSKEDKQQLYEQIQLMKQQLKYFEDRLNK